MDINNQQFLTHLRSALHHLYEPDELRRSPLSVFFGIVERVDAATTLQKILLEAIEAIRPNDAEPPQSNAWMLYELLFFRYVRGYTREAVASQLGISDRQLSREQRTALETLALLLWKTYHLDGSPTLVPEQESNWVESLPPEKPSVWKPVFLSVLDLLSSLMQENDVLVEYSPDDAVPDLLVPPVTLRHALLNVLGRLIPLSKHTPLVVMPTASAQTLTITTQVSQPPGAEPTLLDVLLLDQNIEVARQFIERAGGKLEVRSRIDSVCVIFDLPALEQIPILVVDDNVDALQLFQRYAQGSRYSVMGVSDPAVFFQVVEKVHPRVIFLDLMMPEMDGWDLLSQLRQTQHSPDVAIVICSILPQESLAYSLGADGFLQKPALPQDFLRVLDEQMNKYLKDDSSRKKL